MSTFVHMELNTSDVEGAKKFYKAIFGWKYQDATMADGSVYSMIMGPNGGIGGVQPNPSPEAPPHWLGYAAVDSVKRTVAKVQKNGGTVVHGPLDIPGMGSLAIFADPQGAIFAVWQAANPPAAAEPAAAEQAAPAAEPAKKVAKKAAKKAGKKAAAAKKSSKKAGAKKAGKKAAKKAASE